MLDLTAAHRGYEYQDILVACRLVDVLLGTIVQVHVDKKLFPDDRFDDLTTMDSIGHRERTQFKHTDNDGRPLTLATFTSDARGLRFDRLIAAMLADRSGPGSTASSYVFRVVLRDQPPIDPRLSEVLVPGVYDPGPFIPTMRTTRLTFDSEVIWTHINHKPASVSPSFDDVFAFLASGDVSVSRADLDWVCQHLVIEVAAPAISGDLTAPDIVERLLLTRVRTDVGAELYPNLNRSAVDVAAAMVGAARAARQGRLVVTAEELLRRAQLRQDFGAVSRAHPVDHAIEIPRMTTVRQLAESATKLAAVGGHLLITGPPGQGKSWICQQLLDDLSHRGWLTAEHYCYLGDADGERLARVLTETVIGSLIGRLADSDPRLVSDNRPRFAANEEALEKCIARSLQYEPQRPIALVVDGIDHIARIHPGNGMLDPSLSLVEALNSLKLPSGSMLIVLSQPGAHLRPLEEAGATNFLVPRLDESELHLLAARLRVVPQTDIITHDKEKPLLYNADIASEFLNALAERSAGNALYATYLCREALRHDATIASPTVTVKGFPPFDGTLENYYQHLHTKLGSDGGWVADVIALIDFAVTRTELREIRPDMAHRVEAALEVLSPVLIERAAQGGVRIYHESFARFLRRPFQDDHIALSALLDHIITWLEKKGFFTDPRSFRSLFPLLYEAGYDSKVVALVQQNFVVEAVAAGFPASAINNNLATAIGSATRINDWPAVIRFVELSRAAVAYQNERFDTTLVEFADIPMALLGPDVVADRLLHDDRPVMSARAGLQMCAAVDKLGAVPPWRQYMIGYLREAEIDNTSYGEASDRQVTLAWLRGRLRLSAVSESARADVVDNNPDDRQEEVLTDGKWDPSSPVRWDRIAQWVEERELPAPSVVDAILDTYGFPEVTAFIGKLTRPGNICLALAERIAAEGGPDSISNSHLWAATAVKYGTIPGTVHRILNLGVDLSFFELSSVSEARERLLALTRDVQKGSIRWENNRLGEWLDSCAIAARRDPLGLNVAEALIDGDGWYRCWLRFIFALVRAEAVVVNDQMSYALEAIHRLTEDLNPFSGDPRACDLYSIHGVIEDTIRRSIALVGDDGWLEAFDILREVSSSITTTLAGELGGPLPPDLLLQIAVDSVNPARKSVVGTYINEEIKNGAAHRFYTDLAEYRQIGARFALKVDDREKASILWMEACGMLTAYGWRRDLTIFELLDPLPSLIAADPRRGRASLARIQPVCERIPLHTDGKETRHAPAHWWELLALADPVALANIVAPELLSNCNDPNRLLHGALEDMWNTWQAKIDPTIAGICRLTLDSPLNPEDPAILARLLNSTDELISGSNSQLMTFLLARVDERPVEYSYTNSDDLIEKDDEQVARLNIIAKGANLPPVVSVRENHHRLADKQSLGMNAQRSSFASEKLVLMNVVPCFPPGSAGLARATRTWRTRPYEAKVHGWDVDRFANILGYRIVELAESEREDDAIAALRSLAEASGFDDRSGILGTLGQGLERHNQIRLATIAYTLAWTRARGHGGWLTFGGETEVDSLSRATQLNYLFTLSTIGDEIRQIVATGRYDTYGISQALIYGFAVGALGPSRDSSVDTAFAVFEEAFAVIANRAPRVHMSDDPDIPYLVPQPDNGTDTPGNLESAFALGALASLAHPSREKKRRALLAAQFLLSERPVQAAPAFDIALATLSDPATLTWLLRVIELAGKRSRVIETCQKTLKRLASDPFLTVRALARRLLDSAAPPLPPPSSADRALLADLSEGLLIPGGDDYEREQLPGIDSLIESVAGSRIKRAEAKLPGLFNAVHARMATTINNEGYKRRLRRQLDALADRVEQKWPDAYLMSEQSIEETLQLVASGGRAARIMTGHPISDPIQWEDELANDLLDDSALPLEIEGLRQPRPPIPPPPGFGYTIWSDAHAAAAKSVQHGMVEAAVEHEGMLLATVAIENPENAFVSLGGRFRGWRSVATIEKRIIRQSRGMNHRELVAKRYRAIEVRIPGDRRALTLPPLAAGDIRIWRAIVTSSYKLHLHIGSQPIIGIDNEVVAAGDGRQGLGVPQCLLSPTAALIAFLNLHPGDPLFILEDDNGPGMAHVVWRAEYDTSEYHLARPRITGASILMRTDLFDELLEKVNRNLVLRDFVIGDSELCGTGN